MTQKARTSPSDPMAALGDAVARRQQAQGAYKDLLDARGNALHSVNEKCGPLSRGYLAVARKLKKDEQELERIKTAVRRPISRWGVRAGVLLIIGAGLALLEAFANKFLFDVALQSAGVVSYAVSCAITAFLLLMAHIGGRSIRQVWSDYRQKIIWSAPIVFIIAIGLAGLIVGVLTVARAAFASQGGTIGDLVSGIKGNVQDLGPIGTLMAALSDTSALVLACINVGGIGATFLLAFFSHDSDRDFDHAQNSVDRGEKALEKMHNTYLRERQKTIKQYAPDLLGYAANYNTANARVVDLKTRLQIPLDDDDRLAVTDLDQMSEDAERKARDGRADEPDDLDEAEGGGDGTIASMDDYRRTSGAGAA